LDRPEHARDRQDLLIFIEVEGFADDWKNLRLSDEELFTLQFVIMAAPKAAPIVKGTGGLRKLRFAPRKWRKGKSGAVRVGYVYLQEWGVVLLLAAYAKTEKDDFSPQEQRTIRALIERVKKQFSERTIR